jgi:hypothetical protein
MPACAFTSTWINWLSTVTRREAGDPNPDDFKKQKPLEGNLTEIWNAEIGIVCKSAQFQAGVTRFFRRDVLKMRKRLIQQVLGTALKSMKTPMSEQADLAARKRLADDRRPTDGLVILDYRATEERTIDRQPFVLDSVAFGGLNGVVLLDQGLASEFHSLIAHEIAHCAFLHHWRNTDPSVRENHDVNDDNCLMSYPFIFKQADYSEAVAKDYLNRRFPGNVLSPKAHYCLDNFKPHFCGKCNLQLRGWRVRVFPLPALERTVARPALAGKIEIKILAATVADATADAETTDAIGVSFYPSDKAGQQHANWNRFRLDAPSMHPFPTAFRDNAEAARDPAAFRVEVIDENCDAGMVHVALEALKPMYDKEGKFSGAYEPFPEAERKKRCLVNVECERVAPRRYRSRYLRLVTDEVDRIALAPTKQGLLVTDMADGVVDGEGRSPNDWVEILEQQVRVIYDPTPP